MMSPPCMDWLNPMETTLIFLKPTQFTHFQLAIFFWLELNPEGISVEQLSKVRKGLKTIVKMVVLLF